ncbi:putative mitochondrial hypothetical protein [Leptomonas pyrrhocoris]|uniref:Uncharacterized protein n=1 Tax=Leptomonas pyrrhocoris TaxID=157538 RepID=A0A0M9FZ72_LEPPY|nr:putative mitochondrial hypothetical protein [Leptomonas pyrrhocoris]XP_015657315.1 putative mitochondrial hypothetical protein [Leptomonas pyrrhocoris]KPA78875.1 putative mitochondrial hypothetical protein [Leptomonas pyrrhocoris]KPA78876.1 putative mitochondrial hypothetical protein [Leptomonas pyrrhocoris]|eukprot:XP_015657314.1 putative mitochondrial hypothetical protein [Leptomonas pyrrhocoris]
MFVVRCPASMLWHPSVHHSLLLLRALRQPHTLQTDPYTATRGRLPTPLLSECAMELNVRYQPHSTPSEASAGTSQAQQMALYRPEDVLHTLRCPPGTWEGPVLNEEVRLAASNSLMEYLEASTVSAYITSALDSLLVSLNTGDMETIRQTHARVMDLVERLESTIADEDHLPGSPQTSADPLSTWPLFSVLQFLIEEGGLLMSAFPRTSKAYARLSSTNKAVAQHRRLLQRTVEEQIDASHASAAPTADTRIALDYPAKGFLCDVQSHLAAYNRSTAERTTEGVTGDKGPLHNRVSGGRLGIQAVPARLPWTLQGKPLRKR